MNKKDNLNDEMEVKNNSDIIDYIDRIFYFVIPENVTPTDDTMREVCEQLADRYGLNSYAFKTSKSIQNPKKII